MSRPNWRATYRLQFHAGFTFDDAVTIVPYLLRLGISHVYASPIQKARPGSTHGYDQTDPTRINPELGGEAGFERLSDALRSAGMGMLLDIVPNHMAVHRANPWWMSALAGGRESLAARIFDIDWDRHPQVLQPVLGDTLAETLAQGAIGLELDAEGWLVATAYGEHAWPLRIEDAADLLTAAGLVEAARAWREDRSADLAVAREGMRRLDAPSQHRLREVLATQDLSGMIERQHWRPVHWRSGRDALSSRRFFNINELIGVRVEHPEVFALTHRLPLALLRAGKIDGLRIDHIDGLADPARYTQRLRAEAGPEALIVVEKILGAGETLRADWPVDGTTGYERLNQINRLFVAPEGYRALAQHLEEQGWVTGDPATRLAAAKRQLLEESFSPELEQTADLAAALASADPAIEFAAPTLRAALSALLVHFPVYRSYLRGSDPAPEDRDLWEKALASVEAEGDPWKTAAARWMADLIVLGEGEGPDFLRQRFQQLSGPLMAKGLEDTEFYRNIALLSVNEVGGDPAEPGLDVPGFHAWARTRAITEPRDLTPLATHDTKRGPDTRARLDLLSRQPADFIAAFDRWHEMNAELRPDAGPDPADEWLLYQTLVGSWPLSLERLTEYLTKALREAKRHTRWENPQEAYEQSVLGFATALLEDPRAEMFRLDLAAFVAERVSAERTIGLAQTILQLTLPGVPDLYQGTERWDHSLVDPDNRRPVDYHDLAAGLDACPLSLHQDEAGLSKQIVIQKLLKLRQDDPSLFAGYEPIDTGPSGDWLAFTRGDGRLLVALPLREFTAAFELPLRLRQKVGSVIPLVGGSDDLPVLVALLPGNVSLKP